MLLDLRDIFLLPLASPLRFAALLYTTPHFTALRCTNLRYAGTQAGYVGEDVESILHKLYMESGQDIERCQRGIVYLDEIDKVGVASVVGVSFDSTVSKGVSPFSRRFQAAMRWVPQGVVCVTLSQIHTQSLWRRAKTMLPLLSSFFFLFFLETPAVNFQTVLKTGIVPYACSCCSWPHVGREPCKIALNRRHPVERSVR